MYVIKCLSIVSFSQIKKIDLRIKLISFARKSGALWSFQDFLLCLRVIQSDSESGVRWHLCHFLITNTSMVKQHPCFFSTDLNTNLKHQSISFIIYQSMYTYPYISIAITFFSGLSITLIIEMFSIYFEKAITILYKHPLQKRCQAHNLVKCIYKYI